MRGKGLWRGVNTRYCERKELVGSGVGAQEAK